MRINVRVLGSVAELVRNAIDTEKAKTLTGTAPEIIQRLAAATPKDTGAAASAWVARVDADKIIAENNTPYIGVLNQGHSRQAPALFIEDVALDYGTANGTIVQYNN
jgi:hypothetical protein